MKYLLRKQRQMERLQGIQHRQALRIQRSGLKIREEYSHQLCKIHCRCGIRNIMGRDIESYAWKINLTRAKPTYTIKHWIKTIISKIIIIVIIIIIIIINVMYKIRHMHTMRWESNNAFCVHCWATIHSQQYKNVNEVHRKKMPTWQIHVANSNKNVTLHVSLCKAPPHFPPIVSKFGVSQHIFHWKSTIKKIMTETPFSRSLADTIRRTVMTNLQALLCD
jgi:hypothetical protein